MAEPVPRQPGRASWRWSMPPPQSSPVGAGEPAVNQSHPRALIADGSPPPSRDPETGRFLPGNPGGPATRTRPRPRGCGRPCSRRSSRMMSGRSSPSCWSGPWPATWRRSVRYWTERSGGCLRHSRSMRAGRWWSCSTTRAVRDGPGEAIPPLAAPVPPLRPALRAGVHRQGRAAVPRVFEAGVLSEGGHHPAGAPLSNLPALVKESGTRTKMQAIGTR